MIPEQIIQRFQMEELPEEGGYYSRSFTVGASGKNGLHPASTILYLLTEKSGSDLHRLKIEEVFHFLQGDPVDTVQISASGELCTIQMGPDVLGASQLQVQVPPGVWQGIRLVSGGKWALLGTTTIPEFQFSDYEHGIRAELIRTFPQHEDVIVRFTRERSC